MWSKSKRIALISAVYQSLFWSKLTGDFVQPSWEIILDQISDEDKVSEAELVFAYGMFESKQDQYVEELKVFVRHWDKTFDVVKACLLTFMVELDSAKENNEFTQIQDAIIGKYIRLTQELAGGENPGLIHAITSKILESKM